MIRECSLCGELMCACIHHYNPNNEPVEVYGVLINPGIFNVAGVCETCCVMTLAKLGIRTWYDHDEVLRQSDTHDPVSHNFALAIQDYLEDLSAKVDNPISIQ